MKLTFVSEEDTRLVPNGRPNKYPWAEFFEELYKYPNQWAEFPVKVANSASAKMQTMKFKNIEVRVSGGNNLALEHPDKEHWTAFFRFVPEEDTF